MKGQINVQIAFNPNNKHHMNMLNWLNEQSSNRSSFIKEVLFHWMEGKESQPTPRKLKREDGSRDEGEILNLLG
ncbi:hypothetical protein [Chengkuizengella sediminis]|uniref:hypothetical protein n=1 Tax=Chengkuizengella sediminis TaxID=1885917 RepID=UPI0013896745|nr:hypothetical protein [Chengkuizengella sediminis]NDI34661.1 hypothetical protein [Chengkuizengella sediminis]